MEKEGVSHTKDDSKINVLDENPSCIVKEGNLVVETAGAISVTIVTGEISKKGSTSLQGEKQELVALPDQLGCNEIMVTSSVKENQDDENSVAVDSISVATISDVSQGMEPNSAGVTESVGYLRDVNRDLEVQVSASLALEDEEQKTGRDGEKVAYKNTEVLGTNASKRSTTPHLSGVICCEENNSVEADKQETITQVSENGRIDSQSVQENPDDENCVTIDSSAMADCAAVITESPVEQIQVVDKGEVAIMNNEEVSETREVIPVINALGGNLSSSEKNQNIGAQPVSVSTESEGNMEVCGEENLVDDKQEIVAQVSEVRSVRLDDNEILESNTAEMNLNEGACVALLLDDGNTGSEVQVNEGNTSGEGQVTGMEIAEEGSSLVMDELHSEQTQVVSEDQDIEARAVCGSTKSFANGNLYYEENTSTQPEKQNIVALVAEQDSDQVDMVETMDSCPVNDILDNEVCATVDSNSLPKIPDGSQGTDSGVQVIKRDALGDEWQNAGEIVTAGDLIETDDSVERNPVLEDGQVTKIVFERVDKDPAEENPVEDDCILVDSNSSAEVSNGSHAPSAESAGSLSDEKLDSEVQATEKHASEDEKQKSEAVKAGRPEMISEHLFEQNQVAGGEVAENNKEATGAYPNLDGQVHSAGLPEDQDMATHVSEAHNFPGVVNQTSEVVVATESAGGSSKADGGQIWESHVSQVVVSEISPNECTTGIQNEDLGTGDGVMKEVVSLPDESHENESEIKDMEGEMDISLLVCLDEDQTDDAGDVIDCGNDKRDNAEHVAGFELDKSMEQQLVKAEASKPEPTVRYDLTPEKDGEFSISDLVWGKVRSHPWWPGQIFDSSDASEHAMKYHKKDNFLVAYFGDQTFAWNEASAMKSFRTHFSQMERQNSTEALRIAVDGALDEIRRRVELGMACSCTPEEVRAELKSQIIENPGIQEEARIRDGLDKNTEGISFQPDNLVQYIKELALYPCGGGDRLELVIAKAQLLAFYRLKGVCQLPEYHVFRGLSESHVDISLTGERKNSKEVVELATPFSENEEQSSSVEVTQENQESTSRKRKHVPDDNSYPNRKERSLSDLMAGKKPDIDGQNHADVESSAPQSFKVGECIRRIASQLTGAPPILKCSGETLHERGVAFPKEYSCPEEMLSQLCLAARDPMKGYSFLNVIGCFFSDFRNSISLDCTGSWKQHKKSEQMGVGNRSFNSKIGSAETFDFEDSNDSYWTDRMIQNASDEQAVDKNHDGKEENGLEINPIQKDNISQAPGNSLILVEYKEQHLDGENELSLSSRKNRKRKGENSDPENSHPNSDPDLSSKKSSRKPRKRKEDWAVTATDKNTDQLNNVHEKNGPTALLLKFTEPYSVPSETYLNKIFRRFGPLKESETEVVRDTNSASVVFKTRNDAEVAFSSAGKFSIFGPVVVSYELSYFPLTSSKASLTDKTQVNEDAIVVEGNMI